MNQHRKISFLKYLTLLITILIGSCKSNLPKNVNVDKFYTDHGDWDDARIPFIKPYEAIKLNGYKDWGMNQESDSEIEHIKAANANNGVIVIYGGKTIFQGEYVNQAWHVIIPAKHIEECFTSKSAYLDYLGSIGITHEPKLYDINALASYFGHNDYMDWKEISKW